MTLSDSSPIMLRCVGLSKQFGVGVVAANDVSLEVARGTILALVGPSGCGKTTLLRMVAGLETPDVGAIEVDGRLVTGRGVFVPAERRGVGFVFQDYALFPHMTVAANIAYGLPRIFAGREERVNDMLELVGLVGLRNRRPHELSGGERQRVALARALAPAPKILLMDEPFSNLDPNLSARLQQEVREILHQAGITVVFVTHDQEAALSMGDVVAVMENGQIQQTGAPDEAFHQPVSRFVAGFLGDADFIPATLGARTDHVVTELGEAEVNNLLAERARHAALDLLVRPEDLSIEASEGGNGHVVERVFTGQFYAYRVQLESGRTCRVLASHVTAIEIGARVDVRIAAGHPLPVFPGGADNGGGAQAD